MKILNHLSIGFSNFLYWLEEHQIGILTTIIVHLFIITLILILKIRTYTETEYVILIDPSQLEVTPDELVEEEATQEFIKTMNKEYNIRSIPVNRAEQQAIENIEKMVRDIKNEMNITDPEPPKDTPGEITQPEDKLLDNEARIYEEKYPENELGERTVYKGPTTVSYELTGRRHTWMPAPVYKCQGQGTVIVNITVNQRGFVISADIDKSRSSADPCLVDAAKKDASRSRFNESSINRQQGTITYIFIPQ